MEDRVILEHYNSALLKIAKTDFTSFGDIKLAFEFLTEIAAGTLGVERCSIWFYNSEKTAIVCADLYETTTNTHSSGVTLHAKDFPSYFRYLSEDRVLAAADAHTDPATHEFSTVYLQPLNIFSMLDAPIRISGQVTGVICHEQVGHIRQWQIAEETFAGVIADFAGRVCETFEREKTKKILVEQQMQIIDSMKMAELGQMAAGIAHEINGPLQVILSNAELMGELCSDEKLDREILKTSASSIAATAERIAKIVRSLKNLSRNDSTKAFIGTNVQVVVQDTSHLCSEKFRNNDVELQLNCTAQDPWINGNAISLSQVLLNLLNNALDAITSSKSSSAPKWIKVDLWESENCVHLSVTDSGLGIPEKDQKQIMKAFFTTKAVGKGTGLGLSIAKGLIESHGGTLTLDTTNANTRFVMELPKLGTKLTTGKIAA